METSDWLAGRSFTSWDEIRARSAAQRRGYEKGPNTAGGARARRWWRCEYCERHFFAKPVHDSRGTRMPRRFCSHRCCAADRAAQARRRKQEPSGLEELERIVRRYNPPREPAWHSARVQAHLVGLLEEQLLAAHEAVMGEREWSATQAKAFSALLNRVLPDAPEGNTTRGSGANRPAV
jgi:hypothetical protein